MDSTKILHKYYVDKAFTVFYIHCEGLWGLTCDPTGGPDQTAKKIIQILCISVLIENIKLF